MIQVSLSSDTSWARVTVRDHGVGIAAAQLERIFDLFDRGEAVDHDGLGVGLAVARRLIDLHDGRIQARSDGPGTGSEFIVTLPLASPGVEAAEPLQRANRTPVRILVVDDNADSADSMATLFQLDGHDARCAYDGHDALVAALDFKPHVLVLDIGLPRLGGLELGRRLRLEAWAASALLIALSGWSRDQQEEAAHVAGFDHFLVKPIDYDELAALVASRFEGDGTRLPD